MDGLHPPIISEETFNLAQENMSKNPPRPIGERYAVQNPLSGLVVCGMCNRRMVRRPHGKNYPHDYLMCAATSCPNVSSRLDFVEQRILDGLAEWLNDYRLEWGLDAPQEVSQIEQKRRAAKRISNELAALDKQLDNVHNLLEQGVYTTEMFLDRSRILADKIQSTKDSLEAIETEIVLDAAREESRRNIIPKVEHLLAVYRDLPDAKSKNDMLKEVLEKVVYIKGKGVRQGGTPDGFEVVLYPRLPAVNVAHKT